MPVYEFKCAQCDEQFEKLVRSMSDVSKVPCPKCGSKKTARTLSVFAVSSASSKPSGSPPGMCGRCGGPPGSCGME